VSHALLNGMGSMVFKGMFSSQFDKPCMSYMRNDLSVLYISGSVTAAPRLLGTFSVGVGLQGQVSEQSVTPRRLKRKGR